MTAVFSHSNFFANDSISETREYQIEVITYDGESIIVFVEASNADEAQQMAADMVVDADYTMVQAVMG